MVNGGSQAAAALARAAFCAALARDPPPPGFAAVELDDGAGVSGGDGGGRVGAAVVSTGFGSAAVRVALGGSAGGESTRSRVAWGGVAPMAVATAARHPPRRATAIDSAPSAIAPITTAPTV